MPRNALEKYELLRSIIVGFRERGLPGLIPAFEQEHRRVFDRVSFQFDDPAAQMAADLGEYL